MNWLYLFIAGVLEIGWAIGLGYTQGFRRFWPTAFTLIGMGASVFFLALATRTIPIGTAYALWTGMGAVGAVILGIVLFQEPANLPRLLFVAIILLGIVGLKATSGH
jgi:quaternary ammonium compound-resistance protein SugE